MREKTFSIPETSKILDINGIIHPAKISSDYIVGMINEGNFVVAGNSFSDAVDTVKYNRQRSNVIIFPSRFQVTSDKYNRMSKSLEWLVKADSQPVLKRIAKTDNVPKGLTIEFLEHYKVRPEKLVREAINSANVENPPVGFYWFGWDSKARVVTWMQSAEAAEIMVMSSRKDFEAGKVLDKKPYAKNMRVEVSSRSREGSSYEFSLFRMPIFRNSQDPRIYSYWVNMDHNSSDPLASYMSEHSQQVLPQCFWSTTSVVGVYLSMSNLNKFHKPLQFRINPFPIPINKEAVDFIDDLRLRSLILAKDESGKKTLRPLNKSEMNRIIGARTVKEGYDSCWFNMGKKEISYLYNPRF